MVSLLHSKLPLGVLPSLPAGLTVSCWWAKALILRPMEVNGSTAFDINECWITPQVKNDSFASSRAKLMNKSEPCVCGVRAGCECLLQRHFTVRVRVTKAI